MMAFKSAYPDKVLEDSGIFIDRDHERQETRFVVPDWSLYEMGSDECNAKEVSDMGLVNMMKACSHELGVLTRSLNDANDQIKELRKLNEGLRAEVLKLAWHLEEDENPFS